MPKTIFSFFYKIHTALALFVAVHLIILAVSGSILLFKDELEGADASPLPAVKTSSESVSMQSLLEKALAQNFNSPALAFSVDDHDPELVQFRLGVDGSKDLRGAKRLFFHKTSGSEVAPSQGKSGFLDWLLRLHREFLLGSYGKLYVGFIGFLYVLTLISGFIIHGRFSKKLSFAEIRRGSRRSFAGDLHRLLGTLTFAWGLLIGITGFFLGISTTLIKVYQGTELKKIVSQYPAIDHSPTASLASLDKVLASAQAALPQSKFEFLTFPNTVYAPPHHFLVLMTGNTPLTEKLNELVIIDGQSGELTEVRALPWYLKVTMLSEPMHFGNYGGLPLKIAWLLFTLMTLALPVYGIVIWYYRRQKKAQPALDHNKPPWRPLRGRWAQSAYRLPALIAVLTLLVVIGAFVL